MNKWLSNILKYGFLSLASFVSLFPFAWMIIGATNTSTDITKGKMTFGTELINNVVKLTEVVNIQRVFYNSLKVALLTTLFSLVITSMAAYGFQIFPSKWRDRIFNFLLLAMMIPFAALMIPMFKLIVSFGLINTHAALILPTSASIFLIFYFRQSFRAFPISLIEAARIDGAKEGYIFVKIVVPVMKSTYAAAAIYAFMMSWNNYLWPLIALQTDNKRTLPLVISSLSSAYFPDFGVIMVAIVIATLPMVLIFFFLQKHFTEGMVGSIK